VTCSRRFADNRAFAAPPRGFIALLFIAGRRGNDQETK
jgi:hypothetical protein